MTAAAQVYAQYRAHRQRQQTARDEQTARTLREQERAANRQARMGWAPAHDARWLAQAGLPETADVWGAAAPYAEADPVASLPNPAAKGRAPSQGLESAQSWVAVAVMAAG